MSTTSDALLKAIRAAFPTCTFTCDGRNFAYWHIAWWDGPTERQVRSLCVDHAPALTVELERCLSGLFLMHAARYVSAAFGVPAPAVYTDTTGEAFLELDAHPGGLPLDRAIYEWAEATPRPCITMRHGGSSMPDNFTALRQARQTGAAQLSLTEIAAREAAGLYRCATCRAWRDRDAFGADASRPSGVAARCRECRRTGTRPPAWPNLPLPPVAPPTRLYTVAEATRLLGYRSRGMIYKLCQEYALAPSYMDVGGHALFTVADMDALRRAQADYRRSEYQTAQEG